jgi:hypothetical protein
VRTGWPDWEKFRLPAHWAFANFGRFFSYKSSPNFLGRGGKLHFYKKWLGHLLGDFSQTHLVTMLEKNRTSEMSKSWIALVRILIYGNQ